jgi:hypothetical protein
MVQTMRGKHIDMARLVAENAHKIALGNASMNARGDIINRGQVVKSNEQITSEYHAHNPKAVRQVALRNIEREILTPAEAMQSIRDEKTKKARKIVEEPEERKADDGMIDSSPSFR